MKKWKIVIGIAVLVVLFVCAGLFTMINMRRNTIGSLKADAEYGGMSKSMAVNSVASSMDMVGSAPYSAQQSTEVAYDRTVNTSNTNPAPNTMPKKVIKNADVTLEVKAIDDDFKRISVWVQKNGGYEFSRNAFSNSQNKNISVVFKISPNKLNDFMTFLSETGNVENSNIYSDDITDQYYDSVVRLENYKKGREQLLEIQKRAGTISDLLKVQEQLTQITGEIESMEGKLKLWDKQVDESTVSLSIREENKPIKVEKEITWNFTSLKDVWKTMKNGFIWTTNTLVTLVTWILIFIVAIIPVVIIVAVIIVIVKIVRKRKKE